MHTHACTLACSRTHNDRTWRGLFQQTIHLQPASAPSHGNFHADSSCCRRLPLLEAVAAGRSTRSRTWGGSEEPRRATISNPQPTLYRHSSCRCRRQPPPLEAAPRSRAWGRPKSCAAPASSIHSRRRAPGIGHSHRRRFSGAGERAQQWSLGVAQKKVEGLRSLCI
jgi:hypothetical protein